MARLVVVVALMAVPSCADPPSSDPRGYTKAPLETPGIVIRGETRHEVSRFGTPNLPPTEPLALPDSVSAGS